MRLKITEDITGVGLEPASNPAYKAWQLLWKRLLSPRTAALGTQSVQRALLLEAVILPSGLEDW